MKGNTQMSKTPDLSFEQASVLNADSANIQAFLAHANLFLDLARKAKGKGITSYAEDELDDFANGLCDLVSDLESASDKIEQELNRREGEREREHQRIESAMITRGIAAE
jgi:hypothetical protein